MSELIEINIINSVAIFFASVIPIYLSLHLKGNLQKLTILVGVFAIVHAIYHTTEVDQEIPEGLYLAVAQVLAYVFQLKSYKPGRGKRPRAPKSYDIPDDLPHD